MPWAPWHLHTGSFVKKGIGYPAELPIGRKHFKGWTHLEMNRKGGGPHTRQALCTLYGQCSQRQFSTPLTHDQGHGQCSWVFNHALIQLLRTEDSHCQYTKKDNLQEARANHTKVPAHRNNNEGVNVACSNCKGSNHITDFCIQPRGNVTTGTAVH